MCVCLWCICNHYQNEIKKQENERKKGGNNKSITTTKTSGRTFVKPIFPQIIQIHVTIIDSSNSTKCHRHTKRTNHRTK